MNSATSPGPCPKCRSVDTRRTALKPPRGGGAHRCTPECEKPFRLCLNCRVATPLKEN